MAVFDGVFEVADFGDEEVALVAEFAVGDGADEAVEEGVVHGESPDKREVDYSELGEMGAVIAGLFWREGKSWGISWGGW